MGVLVGLLSRYLSERGPSETETESFSSITIIGGALLFVDFIAFGVVAGAPPEVLLF